VGDKSMCARTRRSQLACTKECLLQKAVTHTHTQTHTQTNLTRGHVYRTPPPASPASPAKPAIPTPPSATPTTTSTPRPSPSPASPPIRTWRIFTPH
jgi:hypothetical protein